MVKIKKQKTEFGYLIEITTNEGTFEISFAGNLDLYWIYKYDCNILDTEDSKEFFITKENNFLFGLFDNLYENIKNYNVFEENEFTTKAEAKKLRKSVIEFDHYQHDLLFRDDKIEWHCDDCIYEDASRLVIEKLDKAYKLTFKKGMVDWFFTYAIRIRNSGSRYHPFNIPFMKMYQELCAYEPTLETNPISLENKSELDDEFHQITIDEYLSQKKLVKKKENI